MDKKIYCWIYLMIVMRCANSLLYTEEYCAGETFTPTCGLDEVVVIDEAKYGRMRLGRCVTEDFGGYVGCMQDVQPIVSRACSGQQTCSVLVTSQNLVSLEPCSADLKSYLEVNYNCKRVVSRGTTICSTSTPLLLSETEGFISSAVGRDRGCGSMKAPWRIEAEPGQSVDVSLINYTPAQQDRSGRCRPLGYIYDVAQKNNVSICDTTVAQEHVYESISHIVEIQLITDIIEDHSFLLHYTVVGCKDIQVPSSMWYKRDARTVTVGCKNNKVSWNLKCEGSQWVGVFGNCTEDDEIGTNTTWNLFADTYTVALIVVVSLGVLLFIVTVLCVYCVGKTILQKRSQRQQQQQQVERNFYYTDSIQRVHVPSLRGTQSPIPLHHGGYMLQPHHIHSPPLPPPPGSDANDTFTERSSEELLPGYDDDQQAAEQEERDPQYFILDKDYMDRATLQIR